MNERLHTVFVGRKYSLFANYEDTRGLTDKEIEGAFRFKEWLAVAAPEGFKLRRICVTEPERFFQCHCEIDNRSRDECVRVLVSYERMKHV